LRIGLRQGAAIPVPATLTLLGAPALSTEIPSGASALHAKDLALLAFLVNEPGPHTRDAVATLLWSDSADEQARASLRQSLKRLRSLLGEALRCDRRTVEWQGDLACDVLDFEAAAAGDPANAAAYDVPAFLSGFALHHASGFEEWAAARRRRLLDRYLEVLLAAAGEAMRRWDWAAAAVAAERALVAAPLSDEACRIAIEARYLAGDRAAALARAAEFAERLRTELDVEPSRAHRELIERIERDVGVARPGPLSHEWRVRVPRLEPPMVEREAVWDALVDRWRALRGGAGGVILIEGEAGAGTTRLAREFARWAHAEGATVLWGQASAQVEGMPFGPIGQALASVGAAPGVSGADPAWLAEVSRLVPEFRTRFPAVEPPSPPGDGSEQWRLFEGIAQVLAASAAERPVILVIDDAHWCDQDSCALLHHVSLRWREVPILIVATVSPGDLPRGAAAGRLLRGWRAADGTVAIGVAPLGLSGVLEVVRRLGGVEDPEVGRRLATRLHQASRGNPLFLIELLKSLFMEGLIGFDPETGRWRLEASTAGQGEFRVELPVTIQHVVTRRLERVPEPMRELLAVLAVARDACDAALLAAITGSSRVQVAGWCDELCGLDLVETAGHGFRIAHPLFANAVRKSLSPPRAVELHRALALALEAAGGEDLAPRIASHAELGEVPDLAFRAAWSAAEAAVGRAAIGEALLWLDVAAGQATDEERAAQVHRRTAELVELEGRMTIATELRARDTTSFRIDRREVDLPGPTTPGPP